MAAKITKKYLIYDAKIADFLKSGIRNMAKTYAIDFVYKTSYSFSSVLEGLRGPILPVLTWSSADLENLLDFPA